MIWSGQNADSTIETIPAEADDRLGGQLPQFQSYARFVSVDLAKNRRRFYTLTWQPHLWEGGALLRSWGRLGAAGRSMATCYPDRESAQETVERMVRRRLNRGYRLVEVK